MGNALPELPDVWAPVGTRELPAELVSAYEAQNWSHVRAHLSRVMDGSVTDGAYGRELLQFVLTLPSDIDPVFEQYRLAAMVDHGDWDGIRDASLPAAQLPQVRGYREVLTAPVDREDLPPWSTSDEKKYFQIIEYQARRATGLMRHWIQRNSGVMPDNMWTRSDVAVGRHLRFRQLQDTAILAIAESQGGSLEVAHALASEGQRLGDIGEPFRNIAHDIENLSRLAMGDRVAFELAVPRRICEPTGPSPIGACEVLMYVIPLLPLREDDSLRWAAQLSSYIAARMGSPRWQLQSESWRVAADIQGGAASNRTELAGLLAKARRATSGLKCLPLYLQGVSQRRYESFEEAETLARRSGNVWLQVSALAWMCALDPRPHISKHLRLLIDATGWRKLVLVPSEVAADAALGVTSMGEKSEAVLEMALTADRPNVTTELIRRYIDEPNTPIKTRVAAVSALGRVGTTHAREILSRLAQRRDDVGKAAAKTAEGPTYGLSEREIEVLSLAADGLTNKQIGDKLFLSPHTIARHLANARAKLGASNRAEAAVRLHRAGVD